MRCFAEWPSRAASLVAVLLALFSIVPAAAASAEIRTSKDAYAPGEKIVVIFENGPGNRTDWITVVPRGTPDGKPRVYKYLQGAKQGSHTFPGLEAGDYEARLHLNNTHAEPAARQAFRVGDPPAVSSAGQNPVPQEPAAAKKPSASNKAMSGDSPAVVAKKAVFAPGEPIAASFKHVPGHSHDRIAVAKKGAAAQQHLVMVYLRGASTGEHTFEGLPAGEYELRLFLKGGVEVASRHPFTVVATAAQQEPAGSTGNPALRADKEVFSPTETITVHFENLSGGPHEWIALRKRDEGPRSGAPLQAVRGKTSGSVTIGVLGEPGEYEARLYVNNKFEVAASYPFSVSAVSLFIPPAVEAAKVGLLGKGQNLKSQCQVLQNWTERLDREYPEIKSTGRYHHGYQTWLGNLFRDDEYSLVFGRVYAETDAAASAQILGLVRLCQRTLTGDARETFRRYWDLYNAAFAYGTKEEFVQRAKQVDEIQAWIASITDEAETLPPTDEGFARMLAIYGATSAKTTVQVFGGGKVSLLWPSEARAFLTRLEARKSALAVAYAQEKIAAFPAELASIEKIDESLRIAREHMLEADKSAFLALGSLADDKRLEVFHAALAALASEPESLKKANGILADAESYELKTRHPERFAGILRTANDLRERTYRSVIERELAALPGMTERLESINELEGRKQSLRALLGPDAERSDLRAFEAAAGERQQAIFEAALRHFKAELAALPISLRGAKDASVRLKAAVGAAPGLPSRFSRPFAEESEARAAAIYDVLIVRTAEDIRNQSGNWRQAATLVRAARSKADEFAGTTAAGRASSLVSLALQRANEWVQRDLPAFQSQVAAIADNWDGLKQLDSVGAELSAIGIEIPAFLAYAQAIDLKREKVAAALEQDALATISAAGTTYKDLESIIQTGSNLAARFEGAGLPSTVPAIDEATASRISEVVEGTRGQFSKELVAMKPAYESVVALEEQAAELALLAAHVPAFLTYEPVTRARIAEMQKALCDQYIGILGISEPAARQIVLGPEGGLEFRELACRARSNGHQVSAIEREHGSQQAKIKVMQTDGAFVHVKLHSAEARPGEVMLVGYAAGDANSQSDMSVSDWEDYVAWLIRERPHGVPDANGITACDRVAADPADPQRVADGVAEADLDPELAIDACVVALEYNEEGPRLRFQFARALLGAGLMDQSLAILEALAGSGYAAAAGYLADHLAGKEGAGDDDWQRAMSYYRQAASGGYQPAAEMLAALDAGDDPSQAGSGSAASLSQPAWIHALTKGELAALRGADRSAVKIYLYRLAAGFSQVCFSGTTKRLAHAILLDQVGGGNMNMDEFAARGFDSFGKFLGEMTNPGKMFGDLIAEGSDMEAAAADATALSTQLGCDSAEMRTFISNAIAYYQGRG